MAMVVVGVALYPFPMISVFLGVPMSIVGLITAANTAFSITDSPVSLPRKTCGAGLILMGGMLLFVGIKYIALLTHSQALAESSGTLQVILEKAQNREAGRAFD